MMVSVLCMTGCGETAGNNTSTSSQGSAAASTSQESKTEESSVEDNKTAALSGTIQMVGSTSMEKLATALEESFMDKYPDVTVTAEFVGSGAGIEAVNSGNADIGNSSRNLKDE